MKLRYIKDKLESIGFTGKYFNYLDNYLGEINFENDKGDTIDVSLWCDGDLPGVELSGDELTSDEHLDKLEVTSIKFHTKLMTYYAYETHGASYDRDVICLNDSELWLIDRVLRILDNFSSYSFELFHVHSQNSSKFHEVISMLDSNVWKVSQSLFNRNDLQTEEEVHRLGFEVWSYNRRSNPSILFYTNPLTLNPMMLFNGVNLNLYDITSEDVVDVIKNESSKLTFITQELINKINEQDF